MKGLITELYVLTSDSSIALTNDIALIVLFAYIYTARLKIDSFTCTDEAV